MFKLKNIAYSRSMAVFAIIVLSSAVAGADQVILKNGDVITGKVTDMEAGTVTVKTDYSKPVKIKTSGITGITTDEPVEVHLVDGQVIKGKLSSGEDSKVIVTSGLGVVATVEWKNVEAINPPPVRWTGSVNVGSSVQDGNTDRISVSVGADGKRKTKKDRLTMRYMFNYAEEEEIVSSRNHFGAMKYDYLFTKHFYAYISMELLQDEFKDLNMRTVVGPGLGLQIWDDKVKTLLFEAGGVYINEDRIVAEDTREFTMRGASVFSYTLSKYLAFSNNFLIYYYFEDESYEIRNEGSITSALSTAWALRLAHILEYDSNPSPDISDTDHTYIASLVYKF